MMVSARLSAKSDFSSTGDTRGNLVYDGASGTLPPLGATTCEYDVKSELVRLCSKPLADAPSFEFACTGMHLQTMAGAWAASQHRDEETGLDYFAARYFSGAQGRFTSADPFSPLGLKQDQFSAWISNPQRWNKFSYALNNPFRYIDPTGMNACGTNDDSTCKVTVDLQSRAAGKDGKYHDQFSKVKNQGNYNAIATVKVNGEVAGTFLAKTTPSDSNRFATALAGTYPATLTTHSGQFALRLQPTTNIPTEGPNPSRPDGASFATGILVHQSGIGNFTGIGRDGRAVSEGCQIIPRSQFGDFMGATGMTTDDGTNPQHHFTVTVDTPLNRVPSDAILPTIPGG
jgi:RHS repeat-associated protein